MFSVFYDRSYPRIVFKTTLFMLLLYLILYCRVGAQDIVIARPVQDVNVVLPCDVTGAGVVAWRINGTTHLLNDLFNGAVAGHNISGRNIVVEDIMMNDVRNGSQYRCEISQNFPDPNIEGNLTFLYVAGVPSMVPNVMINTNYALSWGEPFDNLDPIINYTVLCSGSAQCPPGFPATVETTSYPITILVPSTMYAFSVVATNSIGSGKAGVLMINTTSGPPNRVPDVMVNKDSVRINGSNVTLTLSWEEPFSYFGPIINYTVLWNDGSSLQSFITTDSTTRSHTITNLTSMTNYTFSVVATNSIGNGEAGILDYPTPGISQVNIPMIQCEPVNLINHCTVTWIWNSLQEDVATFLVITSFGNFSVSNQSTSLTFPVLSLPGGAKHGEVTVIVIAVNELGQGPPSEVERANITVASSVISAISIPVCTPEVSELYNVNVTCIIHPDSTAELCVVMATTDDGDAKIVGNATVTEGMATVTFINLQCGVTYNITAEGMFLNETLLGSRSSHASVIPGQCPMTSTVDESGDELSTGAAVAISIVVTFIITLVVTALITYIITKLYDKHLSIKSAINREGDSHVLTEDIKRRDPTYATASGNITMDTNPAYGTTATIKMDTNPAYATTSH